MVFIFFCYISVDCFFSVKKSLNIWCVEKIKKCAKLKKEAEGGKKPKYTAR